MSNNNEAIGSFSANLRRLMTLRGVNDVELGRVVKVSHTAIGKYRKGRLPQADVLSRLARFFEVSIDELFHGRDPLDSLKRAAKTAKAHQGSDDERQEVFLHEASREAWEQRALEATKRLRRFQAAIASVLAEFTEHPDPLSSPQTSRRKSRDIKEVSLSIYGNLPAGWPQDREATQQPTRKVKVPAGKYPKGAFGLEVRGDSMNAAKPEPICDGDVVVLVSPEKREPRSRDIVAALIDGGTTLKRLINGDQPAHLVSESTDPSFGMITPMHDLIIQGVVIGKLSP